MPAPPDPPAKAGIDEISTHWSRVENPMQFALRYAPAIRGYLGVFLKNPHDVDDVCQAFLLRVVERGVVERDRLHSRFRDYLIATVRNAALAHLRRRPPAGTGGGPPDEVAAPEGIEFPGDEEWLSRWRRVVLAGAWEALENHQREHPASLCHTALRALVDHPGEGSAELAARVARSSGRAVNAEAFRKQVSRARRLFAGFLVAETARTLDAPTPLAVEEELIDIGVMKYVAPFLPADWRTSGKLLDPEGRASEK